MSKNNASLVVDNVGVEKIWKSCKYMLSKTPKKEIR